MRTYLVVFFHWCVSGIGKCDPIRRIGRHRIQFGMILVVFMLDKLVREGAQMTPEAILLCVSVSGVVGLFVWVGATK